MGTNFDISIRRARYAKIGLINMCEYIGNTSDMFMVEIGSYVGDSTEIFVQHFKHVTCIDPWQNGYDDNDGASYNHDMRMIEHQFNMKMKKYQNITKIKSKSLDVVDQFENHSLDMVYIDGLHTYDGVKADIEAWDLKVKPGGYLCGHDYGSRHFPGVKIAVDEFRKPDATFKDSSWLIRM